MRRTVVALLLAMIALAGMGHAGSIETFTLKGSGTQNRLAKWATTTTLGDSLLSGDGASITLTSGQLIIPSGSAAAPSLGIGAANAGFYSTGVSSIIDLAISGIQSFRFSANGLFFVTSTGKFALSSGGALAWSSGTAGVHGNDVELYRDAANTLAQRNGTNAQTLRVYGTWTNASNLVNAELASSATVVTLAARTLGTGADDIPINLAPAGTGTIQIGGTDGVSGTCTSVTVTKGIVTGCTP